MKFDIGEEAAVIALSLILALFIAIVPHAFIWLMSEWIPAWENHTFRASWGYTFVGVYALFIWDRLRP